MRVKEFKKLLKTDTYEHIIALHTHLKITLTEKQLDEILKRKNEKRGYSEQK